MISPRDNSHLIRMAVTNCTMLEQGCTCMILHLNGSSTPATSWAACKDSSAHIARYVEPLKPVISTGLLINPVITKREKILFSEKSRYNLDYNDRYILLRRYRGEHLLLVYQIQRHTGRKASVKIWCAIGCLT